MKTIILSLIFTAMCFNLFAQDVVYNSSGKKVYFLKEDLDIYFSTPDKSNVFFPQIEGKEAGMILSLLPSAIDLGFKIATNVLENRQKKFTAEYVIQKSYLEAGTKMNGQNAVPDITITRLLTIDGKEKIAMRLVLKANALEGIEGFYYYVSELDLDLSKAKASSKNKLFDYVMEIKPVLIIVSDSGLQKKEQELAPLVLSSIEFGNHKFEKPKYRTGIIPLPRDGMFAEVSIKMVETNKAKIKADKILEVFKNYDDDVKTIINNIIKTDDDSSKQEKQPTQSNTPNKEDKPNK